MAGPTTLTDPLDAGAGDAPLALGPLLAPPSLVPPEYQHVAAEPLPTPDADNPFWLGERYVPVKKLASGELEYEAVPLTLEDLLFPEEEDRVLESAAHTRDLLYLRAALFMHLGMPLPQGVEVLTDHRVDFGAPGLKALGPDTLVIEGITNRLHLPTFYMQTEGGRPRLLIESASPNTRQNDMGPKFDLYWRAGVECYVLIDRGPQNKDPISIAAYHRGARGWKRIEPGNQGRVSLGLGGLQIGVEEDRIWLYREADGQRYPEGDEAYRRAIDAEARARALEQQLAQLQAQLGSQLPPTQPDR